MRLLSLSLEFFRSYDRLDLLFGSNSMQLLVGENGSGKTNIVEAIGYLSQGRSCLGVKPEDVIRWNDGHFRVRADVVSDAGSNSTLEVVFQQVPSRATACFLSDVRVPFATFIGSLPAVSFLPQDLGIFTGPPSQRRAFLDSLLVQLDPTYLPLRMRLERTLKQRNALLKRIDSGEVPENDLSIWDEELASVGAGIQRARLLLSDSIGKQLPAMLARLGEEWKRIEFSYLRSTYAQDEDGIRGEILTLLNDRRIKDIPAGTTTAGPHRDDWDVLIDGRSMGIVASRGQQRAGFVALLFISVSLLAERKKEKPIILLDDVLSELDEAHQEVLLRHCSDYQTIVTTAHLLPGLKIGDVWDVGSGTVSRK
ncbi:MAG: DNA replication and repair protein RecF [Candidatus Peribacteraceae bacterium]|nr:DNA replication and repair protein RecF [Candidatus Peribacteraceae bacterium]